MLAQQTLSFLVAPITRIAVFLYQRTYILFPYAYYKSNMQIFLNLRALLLKYNMKERRGHAWTFSDSFGLVRTFFAKFRVPNFGQKPVRFLCRTTLSSAQEKVFSAGTRLGF
jgi:hypothetical protein